MEILNKRKGCLHAQGIGDPMRRIGQPATRCCVALWWLSAFCLAILMGAATASAQAPAEKGPPQARTLPLNPLTSEEKKLAERVALADPRVKELLGTGRHKTVIVSLLALKPEGLEHEQAIQKRPEGFARNAEVVFFSYDGEFGIRAVVNLDRRVVTEAARIESRDVPLDDDDVAEAFQLALRNSEVVRILGPAAKRFKTRSAAKAAAPGGDQYRVEGLRVSGTEEKDPCWNHRCLRLLFRQKGIYLSEPIVVVDLTARQVHLERREQ